MISMMSKAKIRADDFISVVLIISILVIALTFDKIAITAIFIYPMIAFLAHGIIRIHKGISKKDLPLIKNILNVIWGIFVIIFCMFMLGLVIFQPTVSQGGIVVLLAYPLILTGFAGLVKGLIINAYTLIYRVINVILGITTIILSSTAITYSEIWSLGHFAILLALLILNIIFRSALYLSEFGLSIKNFENLRVVFLIIDGYFLKLEKIERNLDIVE